MRYFIRPGIERKPAPRVVPPLPLYVDTTVAVSGIGTIDAPMNTLPEALAACAGLPDWEVRIKAPSSSPVRTQTVYDSSMNLQLSGWDSEPWYGYGSEVVTGWTAQGGGVYSKSLGWTTSNMAVVTDMTEVIGGTTLQKKLIANTTTPTTPAEGEMGFAAGVLYVHLPGGADPAAHVIEAARRSSILHTYGSGALYVRNLFGRYTLAAATLNGLSTQREGTGILYVQDSEIGYTGGDAVGGSGRSVRTICTRVKVQRPSNDGFNLHDIHGAAHMELNDCEASFCGDRAGDSAQGVSNHEVTTLTINGGRFNYNVSGGMVVINSARCDIHGDTEYGPVVMNGNMRLGNTAGTIAGQAGCAWLDTSVGTVTGDVTVSNGQGVGVRVGPSAVVVGAASINSTGNALPDVGI